MIAKLVAEAQEEATQKAFCDEEIGKSKKSQAEKQMTVDKLQARIDKAATGKATREDYLKSSKDFKDSAEATEQAIVVLKQYYEGALIQVGSRSQRQPSFG